MTDTYVNKNTDPLKPDKPTILKDPNAVLDYTVDWTQWLDDIGDTIQSATAQPVLPTTTPAMTVNTTTVVGKTVVMVIAGGKAGQTYTVTCRITTPAGRTDDRSIFLKVAER